jgi:hypothetical protein
MDKKEIQIVKLNILAGGNIVFGGKSAVQDRKSIEDWFLPPLSTRK